MLVKKWSIYSGYILFAIVLMTYQNIKGPLKPFYYLSIPLSYPINYINSGVYSFVYGIKNTFITFSSLKKDNLRLKKELDILLLKEQLFSENRLGNIRLHDLLALQSSDEHNTITANIISKSQDKWSDTLILDKGKDQGVNKDMAVRGIKGLVGKISNSKGHFSRLNLITDKSFSVAVRLYNSRLSAIMSGTGSNDCILKYIPDEETVIVGDKVITSGLDELFPEGIPVGEVKSVTKSKTGLFQDVIVKPYANPLKLDEVIIIIKAETLPVAQ